jgi:hypothetical protein
LLPRPQVWQYVFGLSGHQTLSYHGRALRRTLGCTLVQNQGFAPCNVGGRTDYFHPREPLGAPRATNQDGIGYYKDNFGNLLFFWDILFGSTYITRQYPAKVGLQDGLIFGKKRWFTKMFYPLVKSKREHFALTPGGKIYADA